MCGRGFQGLNQALLFLLPKRPDAAALGDYRPISLIHIFAKLVVKTLATRLAPRMESLVDRNQCAFIRKRCIHDNFMFVQQTARFLHRMKEPRVMLKLDIARAFDSVSWGFLVEVLRKMGFGPRFCELVAILLSTAKLRAIRSILELFGHASGLHTNFAKCSVSAIACTEDVANAAAGVMECQLAPFPVKYLGILLSIRRLPGEAFQPMVDRLADKLPTYKASMMPTAGCLALVRSVLAAIPMHRLMVLSFNKKALKQVNKILGSFLWAGRAEANGGHCHVNWSRVSARCGESALFWEDRWLDGKSIRELVPEVYALIPKRLRKRRMVQQALVERSWISDIEGAQRALALWQYVQLWIRLRDMVLSPDQDKLVWRWTTDGQYSSGSYYDTLFQGAISSWKLNWKSWAPPRVKFFIWLACLVLDEGASGASGIGPRDKMPDVRPVNGDYGAHPNRLFLL
ncbi:uncharacterized protein [Lolium perenne]|uniref:uncharacterized protein n=1 Tax=Lolium perenne TaxID=4522 RepID=UPI003A9A25F0